MTSKQLLKQGYIIGAIATICSVMIAISKILRLHEMLSSDYYPKYAQVEHVTTMCVAIAVTLFSIVMILGVVKKRCWLVAPLLVAAILISCYITFMIFKDVLRRKHFYFDDCLHGVLMMGAQILIIYPMCQLFVHLRHLNAVKQTVNDSKHSKEGETL